MGGRSLCDRTLSADSTAVCVYGQGNYRIVVRDSVGDRIGRNRGGSYPIRFDGKGLVTLRQDVRFHIEGKGLSNAALTGGENDLADVIAQVADGVISVRSRGVPGFSSGNQMYFLVLRKGGSVVGDGDAQGDLVADILVRFALIGGFKTHDHLGSGGLVTGGDGHRSRSCNIIDITWGPFSQIDGYRLRSFVDSIICHRKVQPGGTAALSLGNGDENVGRSKIGRGGSTGLGVYKQL